MQQNMKKSINGERIIYNLKQINRRVSAILGFVCEFEL